MLTVPDFLFQICCCCTIAPSREDNEEQAEINSASRSTSPEPVNQPHYIDPSDHDQNLAAENIMQRSLETLSWRKNIHANGTVFYTSVLTDSTTLAPPAAYISFPSDEEFLAEPEHLHVQVASPIALISNWNLLNVVCQSARMLCRTLGIKLLLCGIRGPEDANFGNLLQGTPPLLVHCAFYQHLLIQELSLYPASILRRFGVTRLVLVDNLSYRGQPRKAVPVVYSGVGVRFHNSFAGRTSPMWY